MLHGTEFFFFFFSEQSLPRKTKTRIATLTQLVLYYQVDKKFSAIYFVGILRSKKKKIDEKMCATAQLEL